MYVPPFSLTTSWLKICFLQSLTVRNFNLNASLPFPSIFLRSHLPLRWDHAWHWTSCTPWDVQWGLLFIFLMSSLCSQADCIFLKGRACIFCPRVTPAVMPSTYLMFNKKSRKRIPFRPCFARLKGIVLCTKFRKRKLSPSKIASFCILHFDDVSKVWFPRFFMPLIDFKLPYISIVSHR